MSIIDILRAYNHQQLAMALNICLDIKRSGSSMDDAVHAINLALDQHRLDVGGRLRPAPQSAPAGNQPASQQCPSCGSRRTRIFPADGMLILGCWDCRYSQIVGEVERG